MSRSLFSSYFADKLRLYPSMASYLGDRRRDGHYEDALSPEMLAASKELFQKYHNAIEAKQKKGQSLTMEDIALSWEVKMGLEGLTFPLQQLAVNSFHNIVIDLSFNESQLYPHPSESRYHDYIAVLRTAIFNMKQGIASHNVLPRFICEKMIHAIQDFVNKKQCIKGTEEAVNELLHFLKQEYLPACRTTIGLCELPRGKAMYRHLIREQTSTNMTPEAIHEYGLKEVERLEKELRRVQEALGGSKPPGGLKRESLFHFYKRMLANPDYICKTTQEIMKRYRDMQKRVRDTVWKENFAYALKTEYHIKKVPKDMEDSSAGAFYVPSSYRPGEFEGTFYVNTRNLRENPIYSMYALSLHEGFHHYQYQYMIENKLPSYMIFGISNNAYAEGIALYAEELGTYSDPLEEFGFLTSAIFRAARLVIDTGIHWYGWSHHKAVEYMTHHVPLSADEITTEIERYICYPAQALCYSIGRKVFVENREKYLKAFPDGIQDYHTLILEDGTVPLHLITSKVDHAIKKKSI
jgi:uncharacterized protein (DUF885 family)